MFLLEKKKNIFLKYRNVEFIKKKFKNSKVVFLKTKKKKSKTKTYGEKKKKRVKRIRP